MDESKGQVLTVWLTADDLWLLEAIENFRDELAARGIEMKRNAVIRQALTAQLEPFRREPAISE